MLGFVGLGMAVFCQLLRRPRYDGVAIMGKTRLLQARLALLALLTLVLQPAVLAQNTLTTEAKAVFKSYEDLGSRYDPALADLYADNAVIQNTRYYPDGRTQTINIPAPQYKKLLITAIQVAKAKGAQDTYSKVTYKVESGRVRVTALRHSHLKNYDSWLVLLLEKRKNGWKIVQELSQSRP